MRVVVTEAVKDDQADYAIHLLSLPARFGTTLDTVPADIPYLRADPNLIKEWRERLPKRPRRIGLVWAGNPNHPNDANRSIALAKLQPLLSLPDIAWVSLQVADGRDQLGGLPQKLRPTDMAGHIRDFADTAAIIDQLDMLISVDTSVAHLAGTMGKPVWMLVPKVPDWRWMLKSDRSPWYPTMRLFRQTKAGDWDGVVERIGADLRLTLSG